MSTAYLAPLGRGWDRMKTILFRPFDIKMWFVFGFTVFLAELTDLAEWGEIGAQFGDDDGGGGKFGRGFESIFESLEGIVAGGIATAFVLWLALGAMALWVLFLWLSSRGHFMFLDNLVHSRSRVSEPWAEFAKQGNSLFVWRVVYTVICMLSIGPFIALAAMSVAPFAFDQIPGGVGILSIIGFALVLGLFMILATYVDFFLLRLVAPVMYKHRISSTEAWRRFWPVFRSNLIEFLLYGIFVLVLHMGIWILTIGFGLLTCCIGWLILAIPYLGTVIFLPVSVTLRGLDLEFLAQFGEDFDLVSGFQSRE